MMQSIKGAIIAKQCFGISGARLSAFIHCRNAPSFPTGFRPPETAGAIRAKIWPPSPPTFGRRCFLLSALIQAFALPAT